MTTHNIKEKAGSNNISKTRETSPARSDNGTTASIAKLNGNVIIPNFPYLV